jgi:hypothetical protein
LEAAVIAPLAAAQAAAGPRQAARAAATKVRVLHHADDADMSDGLIFRGFADPVLDAQALLPGGAGRDGAAWQSIQVGGRRLRRLPRWRRRRRPCC